MVKTHVFNGRRYRIGLEQLDGLCDRPEDDDLELHILVDLNSRKGLITAIHESLHAENKYWTEEAVDRVSREIGDFLWRLGYRIKET